MYLHRTYMVEALTRWPENPLNSKFALSVLAVHRSSLLIMQGLGRLHSQLSELAPRIFFLWLHVSVPRLDSDVIKARADDVV